MRLAAAPLMLLGAAALPAAGSGIAEVQDVVPRALSAREIVERSREHWNRYDTSVRMKIQVVGRTGRWFERRLEAARVRVEGASRVLIRMLDPPDLRNTRLLVIEKPDGADERFIYLPSSRRVRRIAAAQAGDRFLGSDFSYEDIGLPDLDRRVYERHRDEDWNGVPCYVIESRANDHTARVEGHRSWISREAFVLLRVDYERRGTVTRRLTVAPSELEEFAPGSFLPRRLVMRNLRRGSRTEIWIEEIRLAEDLPREMFSLSRLERLRAELLPGKP
ncbi:MAG: outer membrane lipoprotein-sorting protein [Myxococcales bacterium]|nr:outer membrane lipoprotein-sorting protein [Myxococcales bacterium]